MKRPHRRMHLLLWLLIAPATTLAAVYALTLRPEVPSAEAPDFLEEQFAREAG